MAAIPASPKWIDLSTLSLSDHSGAISLASHRAHPVPRKEAIDFMSTPPLYDSAMRQNGFFCLDFNDFYQFLTGRLKSLFRCAGA